MLQQEIQQLPRSFRRAGDRMPVFLSNNRDFMHVSKLRANGCNTDLKVEHWRLNWAVKSHRQNGDTVKSTKDAVQDALKVVVGNERNRNLSIPVISVW